MNKKDKKRENIEKFKKANEYYEILFDINNEDDLDKYLNEEINIIHKKCGNVIKIRIKDLLSNVLGKTSMCTLSYLDEYIEDRIEMKCPHCLQEAKNRFFSDKLEEKFKGSYVLEGNFQGMGKKVKIKHVCCGNIIEAGGSHILNITTKPECSKCNSILSRSEKDKYAKVLDMCNDFIFEKDIKNIEIFKKYLYEEIEVTHLTCNKTYKIKINDFFTKKLGKTDYLIPYMKNKNDLRCTHCFQEAKNKYFSNFLEKEYKGEYLLYGDYISKKDNVSVLHKNCGKINTLMADIIFKQDRRKYSICDCKQDVKYQKLQKERNEYLLQELKKNNCEEFEPLEDFIDKSKEMNYRHKVCGYEFRVTTEKLINRINKCPVCTENGKIVCKDQKEKNEIFQKRLDERAKGFKLVGNYYIKNEVVRLYHEDCKQEFSMIYNYFEKSNYKCPCCQTKRYKHSQEITVKEKIKYFERELNHEYKILDVFMNMQELVRLKHVKCGKTFEQTMLKVMSHKNIENICPHCELEKRKQVFLKKLKDKYGDSFELVGQYVSGNKKTLFKHECCDKAFSMTPNMLLSKRIESCPHCKEEKMRLYQLNKFKIKLKNKYGKEYILAGEYKGHDKKVLFKHRDCGTRFLETPYGILYKDKIPCPKCFTKDRIIPEEEVSKRISEKNGNSFTIVGEYMGTEKLVPVRCNHCGHVEDIPPAKLFRKRLCSECEKEKRKNIFLDKLQEKFGDSYQLVGEYVSVEVPTYFIHKSCKTRFKILPKVLLNRKKDYCPSCEEEKTRYKYKKDFQSKLLKKHRDKYMLIGEYIDYKTKVLFKHVECGHEFLESPNAILKSDNPCSECSC